MTERHSSRGRGILHEVTGLDAEHAAEPGKPVPLRMPVSLVLSAVETAEQHGAAPLSEAHLVHALLGVPRLARVLSEHGVSAEALRSWFEPRLGRDTANAIDVVKREDGGKEIVRYGLVDNIEGRAVVLARTPQQHRLDSVDVFVAAIFDPYSLSFKALQELYGPERRTDLLDQLATTLNRYKGVSFP